MAGDARARPGPLFVLLAFAAALLMTSRAQQPPSPPTDVKVGLIINATSPVGKIVSTTIPMALQDFYATFPDSRARVQILQHDSGGETVAAAAAGMAHALALQHTVAFLGCLV